MPLYLFATIENGSVVPNLMTGETKGEAIRKSFDLFLDTHPESSIEDFVEPSEDSVAEIPKEFLELVLKEHY